MSASDDQYVMRPIGHVRTGNTVVEDTPIQARLNEDARGTVIIDAPFAAGLEGLDGFDHAWLLTILDRDRSDAVDADPLRPTPFLATEATPRVGVFATRYPVRPNAIGLSLIRIEGIDGLDVSFTGVDLVDGTPVLDLKPWVPQFDLPNPRLVEQAVDIRIGWYRTSALGQPDA